jgi:ferritin-like metal-binding protein YciE
MKLFSEKLPDLKALYFKHIRTLLSAEEVFVRGLQRMAEAATDNQLKQAFRDHGEETEKHGVRLRHILQAAQTGETDPVKCKVASDLIDESEDSIVDSAHESVRDAALIAAAQRVEHYEIAAYGAVLHFARVLGREQDAGALSETLQEEGHADHLLSEIAERVNPAARKVA